MIMVPLDQGLTKSLNLVHKNHLTALFVIKQLPGTSVPGPSRILSFLKSAPDFYSRSFGEDVVYLLRNFATLFRRSALGCVRVWCVVRREAVHLFLVYFRRIPARAEHTANNACCFHPMHPRLLRDLICRKRVAMRRFRTRVCVGSTTKFRISKQQEKTDLAWEITDKRLHGKTYPWPCNSSTGTNRYSPTALAATTTASVCIWVVSCVLCVLSLHLFS